MAQDLVKGALVGAVVASVVTLAAGASAGTGVGGVFNLGRTNSVHATSTLTGEAAGPQLALTNGGSGPALGLTVRAGRPPLKVNAAAGKATNLDADELDGVSSRGFLRAGDVMLSQQHGWVGVSGGGTVVDFPNLVALNATGSYLLPLTTPNAIGVHDFYLDDVEICYAAASAGQKIDVTQVFRSTAATTIDQTAFDTTDRTDLYPATSCYTLPVNDRVAPVTASTPSSSRWSDRCTSCGSPRRSSGASEPGRAQRRAVT